MEDRYETVGDLVEDVSDHGTLCNLQTGEELRPATREEAAECEAAIEAGEPTGAILADVDGKQVTCYVEPPRYESSVVKYETITIDAAKYEDHDDCLAAVVADYVRQHPEARGYDLCPRWEDESREWILLDVPGGAL